MPTTCFLLTPTDQASRSLRRYASPSTCPIHGYHDAVALLGIDPLILTAEGTVPSLPLLPQDDPRWPVACACGYRFTDTDPWQHNQKRLYQGPDGTIYTIHPGDAPPGAMWNAPWYQDVWPGPDGQSLVVVLPSGEHWAMDTPATGGGHWTRTGTPPLLTVTPSIAASRYHGFLTNGILTDDLEGRTY